MKNLYQEYSHKAQRPTGLGFPTGLSFIDDNVKITDLTGWTNIDWIIRVEFERLNNEWITINTPKQSVVVDNLSDIPFYIPENNIRGFHGEVKYQCGGCIE